MKQFLVKKLFDHVSRKRNSALTKFLFRLSSFVRKAYFNSSNHDIRENGELRILQDSYSQHRDQARPFVIFDVGANEGDWSKLALEACKNCMIHAFEIVPDTREILSRNLTGNGNVVINEAGLSNEEQEVEIKYYPSENTGSSEFDLPWSAEHVLIKAQCTRGDLYMTRNNIDKIDFLKIDVEGADYKVLQGFEEALATNRIDRIQFEYNKAAIISKIFLRDLYLLLGRYDYEVGRILPNRIDFKEYDLFNDENLLQSNFFAIKKELFSANVNAKKI